MNQARKPKKRDETTDSPPWMIHIFQNRKEGFKNLRSFYMGQ